MSREFIGKDLKIYIDAIEIDSSEYVLKKMRIDMEENNHSTLHIEIEIREEYRKKYTINKFLKLEQKEIFGKSKYNNKKIEIKFNELEYFSGIIKNIKIRNENSEGTTTIIEAKSKSEILDRVKKYRVYQNINATYEELIKEVLSVYQKEVSYIATDKLAKTKTNKIFIQYNETEWEFLVRLMSNIGLGIFSGRYGEIIFGYINNESKRMEFKAKSNTSYLLDERGNVCTEIIVAEAYLLGEGLYKNKEDYGFISLGKLEYINGQFSGEYTLRNIDYRYAYISNKNIEGGSIEARVIKIPKENKAGIAVLLLNFSEGVKKISSTRQKINRDVQSKSDYLGEKVSYYEFPYTTPYSKSNTGFFCTPEIEDNVTVYFPIDEENSGYVAGSVNNKEGIRFSNPYERNYTLLNGEREKIFNLDLKSDNYTLYAKDLIGISGVNVVKINSEKQILADSKDQINISSDNILGINAGKELISTTENSIENVTKLKQEKLEMLDGVYISGYSVNAQSKKEIIKETYSVLAGDIIMKS
ncbi:MAG: contractile injection system protein, VgrG/Pvc8 family [Fusobacteriaceae bacterium]